MQNSFEKVAIVGMGLIGASLSGALARSCPEIRVLGIDVDADALSEAESRGWIQEGFAPDDEGLPAALLSCDLVVLATPVPVAPRYFALLAEVGYEGMVTDTCSTKREVVKSAQELLPNPSRFLPGHPMSGSEKNGIEGAHDDLFDGCHWILCPDSDTPADLFASIHDLLTTLGARVVSLPRELHDGAVAVVSHVPHFTASSLVELAVRHADGNEQLFRLAAGGFKDSTRIAAGSPELWTGIAFDNAEAIASGLEEMQEILHEYSDALRREDRSEFTRLLERAAKARRALPAKWIPASEDLLEVRVPLSDRKGVVAEVTTIASQVGCNIQSIEIDHVTSSTAVLSLVLTDEGDVGKLSLQLIRAGYRVSFNPLFAKEAEDHE
ncbi:MAG: prephenate dehydrogenase [Coriobacteriia bacterium]|nr:prephenate dehydrogenase [Coriobacteriia bacterium]